jgi:hypothetical protein
MLRLLQGGLPIGTLSLALAFMGCALFLTKETQYLLSAKNQATKDDVRRNLGEPKEVSSYQDGKTRWIYERQTAEQEGTNDSSVMFNVWRCDTYSLEFDENRILRDWFHSARRCGKLAHD